MFNNLRYIYAASFVLIVFGALVVGVVIRGMMSDGLTLAVKRDNISLAQSYINSVWAPYYPANPAAFGTQYQTYLANFQAQTQRFAQQLATSHFSLYDYKLKNLFSSGNVPTDAAGATISLMADNPVLAGKISSAIYTGVSFSGPPSASDASLILMHFPILNPQYNGQSSLCQDRATSQTSKPLICQPVSGIIEIGVDVSEQWQKLDLIQWVSSASIIGIFVILILILVYTTHRAEAIITRQHEVNLELSAAAANAEAENRDKSQFLANISHELRTPLNAIIGFSEIIRKEAMEQLSATHQEYITDINNSGKHLLSLINDILDFSKAEAGKLEVEAMEIDLNKLIINSMRLVIPRAEEAQVTLVEDLPPDHIVFTTDGKKLKQVLLNLLSNAVKFTPPGGEVKVSAWQQLLDNMVCIQVKDSGIGIAPKDIAKVMSPFGQVDSKLSRRYEGTGLGLPLSKKFIEIMGGIFTIDSEVNVGTTITIKLPGTERQTVAELKTT